MIELSAEEREYLIDLLTGSHREMLHQLHHTDSRNFQRVLKMRLEVSESLRAKLQWAHESMERDNVELTAV